MVRVSQRACKAPPNLTNLDTSRADKLKESARQEFEAGRHETGEYSTSVVEMPALILMLLLWLGQIPR